VTTIIPDPPHPLSDVVDGTRRASVEWWKWFADLIRAIRKRTNLRRVNVSLDHAVFAITAVSKANPCVMTITGHTMIAGDFFFIGDAGGMSEIRYRWFNVESVNGNLVTVNATSTRKGEVVKTTAVNSSAYTTYTGDSTASPQCYRGTWTVPDTIAYPYVYGTVRGAGAAGGGSEYDQYGGAGGGGAAVTFEYPATAGDEISYVIDRGMPGIPADTTNNEYLYAGITALGAYAAELTSVATVNGVHLAGDTSIIISSNTSFVVDQLIGFVMDNAAVFEARVDSLGGATDVNLSTGIPTGRHLPNGAAVYNLSPRRYAGDAWCYGAGVGEPAASNGTGGDGGTPGIGGGTYVSDYAPGGKGSASPPAVTVDSGVTYFNASLPRGGAGAMGGGQGGDIGQGGSAPGGGGAPGYDDTGVEAGFACTASACPSGGGHEYGQSGEGAAGRIELEYWIEDES
jgi:hypothetical protein